MKILVGSKNPTKIEAVKEAFSHYFEDVLVEGREVESEVPGEPKNQEVILGAKNRARNLSFEYADFYVGIEAGIMQNSGEWFGCGMICVMDSKGKIGLGSSAHFQFPTDILSELQKGRELGDFSARFTGDPNEKHKGGTIGFLTKNIIRRKDLYVPGIVSALIPFLNEDLYK